MTLYQFKIDLIVWKLKKRVREISDREKFKIDLIVWKLLMMFW